MSENLKLIFSKLVVTSGLHLTGASRLTKSMHTSEVDLENVSGIFLLMRLMILGGRAMVCSWNGDTRVRCRG